ncbi:hypothetical protein KQI52_09785 [bacterium]|nr:hypothetical protein [bacterium]
MNISTWTIDSPREYLNLIRLSFFHIPPQKLYSDIDWKLMEEYLNSTSTETSKNEEGLMEEYTLLQEEHKSIERSKESIESKAKMVIAQSSTIIIVLSSLFALLAYNTSNLGSLKIFIVIILSLVFWISINYFSATIYSIHAIQVGYSVKTHVIESVRGYALMKLYVEDKREIIISHRFITMIKATYLKVSLAFFKIAMIWTVITILTVVLFIGTSIFSTSLVKQ